MSVKQLALVSAIDRLKAIGAQFAIITADGKQFGDLKLAKPEPKKKPRPNYQAIYRDQISQMKVGDVVTLKAGEGVDADNLRCSAQAYLIQRYGTGASTSTVSGNTIEILRLK
jgi:hypothetical protein